VSPSLLEVVLLAFVLLSALGTALLKDTLASVMAFATYSLGISIIWVLLQAPDVALTEAAVGAGVMTLLFLITLANTVRPAEDRTFERVRLRTLVAVLAFVLVLGATVPALPAVGADAPESAIMADENVTQHYIENAYEETEVHNAVTAVLAAYRGFDTLGEAVVVFVAGVAALAVLRKEAFA
jgi:multicomponent Na+:H+ antiporter subunit B